MVKSVLKIAPGEMTLCLPENARTEWRMRLSSDDYVGNGGTAINLDGYTFECHIAKGVNKPKLAEISVVPDPDQIAEEGWANFVMTQEQSLLAPKAGWWDLLVIPDAGNPYYLIHGPFERTETVTRIGS